MKTYKAQCGSVKSEELVRLTDKFSNTIEENSVGKERVVFRGVNVKPDSSILDLASGDTLDMASFTSATTDISIAESFSGGYSNGSVVFEMKTPKGMYIAGDESEIISPRNTKWRVVEKKTSKYINSNVKDDFPYREKNR